MGNAASLNENFNSKMSNLNNMDFTKSYFKNVSNNKCSACKAGINLLTLKRRKCTQCLELYCVECVTHYKESIYMCYRCEIFISPSLDWTRLMSLKSKDLAWFLDRKHISHPYCTDKEQLVDIILDKFGVVRDQKEGDLHRRRLAINMENLLNFEQEACSSSDFIFEENVPIVDCSDSNNVSQLSRIIENIESSPVSTTTAPVPPSYDEALEGGYTSCPTERKCQRVKIEDIQTSYDIDDFSVKQLKDLLAYNKVDYKGCLERHELVTRVQRLWTAYNDDRGHFSNDNTDVKECVICMDQPVDCVLIECGHMLCCVRCGSQMAECPLCRQNVVRCIRVFSAH